MTPDMKISKELQAIGKELETRLSEVAGQKMLFSLLVYQAEEGSRMNYLSNAQRDSVTKALTSLLHGWENGMPDIPAHKIS